MSLAVNTAASDIALEDDSARGVSFARNVVAPLVNRAVRNGDRAASGILDAAMNSPLRDGALVRVKVWSQDGHVVWSDAARLHGERFVLEPEEAALFGTDAVLATFSDLSKAENAQEQAFDELLEVYAAARDSDGVPILVESYWNTDRIVRDEVVISIRTVPLALGLLTLFLLTLAPLALSLARRLDKAQTDRVALLQHALAASDTERRRISRELHDGVIQDLTSLGYVLPAVRKQLPDAAGPEKEVLRSLDERLRTDIASLRGIITDLYPVSLAREGLAAAVEQLAAPARTRGIEVLVEVQPGLQAVSREALQLAYQVIREGLRNVVKHARASSVRIVAVRDGGDVVVTVDDDGLRGPEAAPGDGHLGLRLLEDCVTEIGGSFSVGASGLGGTRLAARFPAMFVWSWAR
ncbi:sensor histidine kinase [Terrabacter terrigena]|uniref:Sensor histidine kinase n=1 Tax=Terrabacter terrigena TaxID=574718 RepID=A0ABW3MTW8_9MICO